MPIKKFFYSNKKSNGVSVIIPAAGLGLRFQKSGKKPALPKLFTHLKNQPLILHVLKEFDRIPSVHEIILPVESKSKLLFQKEILSGYKFKKRIVLVRGGKTRAESVWNALQKASPKSEYICVHDGARPLFQAGWLTQMLRHVNGWDGLVLGRSAVPTVKVYDPKSGEVSETLNRKILFEAETPQLLKREVFIKAYQALGKRAFQATDDVSIVEASGGRIKAVIHSEPNIKITTHQDLNVAKSFLGDEPTLRFGLGFDRHRLVSGKPLLIGGIKIKSDFGSLGHSDGDALLHAVTDAILGAIGAGDIGDFFPNTKKWKNKKSELFLSKAVALALKRGLKPAQVDTTIILQRPKLHDQKQKIKKNLAKLLSISEDKVSIKAKTSEGLGPEGEGRAISVQSLVVLGPLES